MLEALDLNVEIPPNLYHAVAEVLAFVYRLNRPRNSISR
jgi:type III secretion system FlhB-like substrate exporter